MYKDKVGAVVGEEAVTKDEADEEEISTEHQTPNKPPIRNFKGDVEEFGIILGTTA